MGKLPEYTIIKKYGSIENYKEYLHKKLSGKHYYTNGVEDRKFSDDEEIPEGWWRGRTNSGKGTKGYFFINNGDVQTQVECEEDIPDGYVKGALPFTEQHRQRISESLKSYTRTEEHNENLRKSHLTETYKENIKRTNLLRYGVENPFQSEEIKNKIREKNLKKYGYEYASKSDEIKEKVKNTVMDRYGVMYACQRKECRLYHGGNSKPNLAFEKLLKSSGIEYEREFPLEGYSYDFKIRDILIEIDPYATHNSLWSIFGGNGISKNYHAIKSKIAYENGYRCIHVFDWDEYSKILNIVKDSDTVYARKCKIKEVSTVDCNKFLNDFHLQGTCRGQNFVVGLYFGEELISLMSFGKPRYNKNYEWELLRYCTIKNVIGGANRLFTFFIKKYSPCSVISYCDMAKFSGKVYETLGFRLKYISNPSKHWYGVKSYKHYTDNFIRQHGYDNIFGANYGKGTSNDELLIKNNYVPIYDCGQGTYIWEANE